MNFLKMNDIGITLLYVLGLFIMFLSSTIGILNDCSGVGWLNIVGLLLICTAITIYYVRYNYPE